jgi:hypothetical protein
MGCILKYNVIEAGFVARRHQFNELDKAVECAVTLIRAGKQIGIQTADGMTSQSYHDLNEGIKMCMR